MDKYPMYLWNTREMNVYNIGFKKRGAYDLLRKFNFALKTIRFINGN
jgi:hypothetical protein